MAPHNVQVNAIAQNFVENPTYFPAEVQANPRFKERLQREVPLGRLVSATENEAFAAYLCSDAANFFVGQVFPVCGAVGKSSFERAPRLHHAGPQADGQRAAWRVQSRRCVKITH